MKKKLILYSGGLDSTVLLYTLTKRYLRDEIIALSIYYGQKHAIEREYALWHCKQLSIQLIEVDLSQMFKYNLDSSALLQGSKMNIIHKSYAKQLADLGGSGTISAYVPYRNGLFLSFAAVVALQLNCNEIFYGAHADDAAGRAYPDCTEEFIVAQADAIYHGTAGQVEITAPWMNKNKADIIAKGIAEGMTHKEFEYTWSCYEGNELTGPCGTCGTCIDRKAAFVANGILDIN